MISQFNALETACADDAPATQAPALAIGQLDRIDDGWLVVELEGLGLRRVAWLESAGNQGIELAKGDRLLVSLPRDLDQAVALGRIGRYTAPQECTRVVIQATESLSLKCGDACVDLRADGQVVVRGEDVLLRARGTQRIRAASVAIN